MATNKAHRTEQMLKVWEDTMFLKEIEERMLGKPASGVDWRGLRKSLLALRPFSKITQIENEFVTPVQELKLVTKPIDVIPAVLGEWCSQSRRIYRLDDRFREMLELTRMKNLQWKDIHPPFTTFGIEFESPIRLPEIGISTDFIIPLFDCKSEDTEHPVFGFYFFDSQIDEVSFITDKARANIEKLVEKRKVREAVAELERHLLTLSKARFVRMALPMDPEEVIRESVSSYCTGIEFHKHAGEETRIVKGSPGLYSDLHRIVHLCVSFVTYLSVIKRIKHVQVGEHRMVASPQGNMRSRGQEFVVDDSRVCTIESSLRF